MSSLAVSKLNPGTKRLAPPSPSPSNASNTSKTDGTPSKRVKREDKLGNMRSLIRDQPSPNTPAAAAATNVKYGENMLTQLTYAVDFLKNKGEPKSLIDILEYLSLLSIPEVQQREFYQMCRRHPKMTYIAGPRLKQTELPAWKQGKFEFRALIPGVSSKATLLECLQAKTDASFISVKDLKDGWPNCDKAIDELEAEHKIVVVRTKKDNHARYIWIDDPTLAHHVDPEFRVMWQRVQLPTLEDIVRKLTAVGQKPASEDPRLKKLDQPKNMKQKKRSNRSNKQQQNVHMAHLLQDYSHMKRG
ncbi:transcription initiation factor TFIIE subunit beta [Microdochium nivale]|nr:transcription initiation factor TFIIE subunit beta [Microdochium nivale]